MSLLDFAALFEEKEIKEQAGKYQPSMNLDVSTDGQ